VDDFDISTRIAGIEAQLTVLSKEVRTLVAEFRRYLDSVEQGQKFIAGALRNGKAFDTFKGVMEEMVEKGGLPAIDEKIVADPSLAFKNCAPPPVGALSPDEVETLLRQNGCG
jgi:hypothetical protein